MDAVTEAESEEEAGVAHEDIEDEISSIFLALLGQSSWAYMRARKKAADN